MYSRRSRNKVRIFIFHHCCVCYFISKSERESMDKVGTFTKFELFLMSIPNLSLYFVNISQKNSKRRIPLQDLNGSRGFDEC